MQTLLALKASLDRAVEEAIAGRASDLSPEFAEVLRMAVRTAAPSDDCSLLACGAAAWCGAAPDSVMHVAVASRLLRAALLCHVTLPGFEGPAKQTAGREFWRIAGEADALLAGDALVPLALEILASCGSRHALILLGDAVKALGSQGILAGYSMELDLAARTPEEPGEGQAGHERPPSLDSGAVRRMHSGRLAGFASASGALEAGASRETADEAFLIGLMAGRASDLLAGCVLSRQSAQARQEAETEASALLDEALGRVGDSPEGDLLRRIMETIWTRRGETLENGSGDLFGGLS